MLKHNTHMHTSVVGVSGGKIMAPPRSFPAPMSSAPLVTSSYMFSSPSLQFVPHFLAVCSQLHTPMGDVHPRPEQQNRHPPSIAGLPDYYAADQQASIVNATLTRLIETGSLPTCTNSWHLHRQQLVKDSCPGRTWAGRTADLTCLTPALNGMQRNKHRPDWAANRAVPQPGYVAVAGGHDTGSV
jgi:hypothetical protein